MRSGCYLVVGLLLLATVSYGQLTHDIEFAIFAGVTNYQGDLAEYQLEFNETRPAYGALFRYQMTPKIGARVSVFHGTLSGDDDNSNRNRERGLSFTAPLTEITVGFEYYPFGKRRYNNAGIFQPRLSPFVYVCVGPAFAQSDVFAPGDSPFTFPASEDRSSFLVTPVGAGVRMDLINHVNISAEIGWRPTFSDYLDGVSLSDSSDDWYWFGGLTVGYYFMSPNPYRR